MMRRVHAHQSYEIVSYIVIHSFTHIVQHQLPRYNQREVRVCEFRVDIWAFINGINKGFMIVIIAYTRVGDCLSPGSDISR